jgi:DNA-binding LacI/PurR family transcriptional regulator
MGNHWRVTGFHQIHQIIMSNNGATMQDIAEKLGISIATVSRALRRVPGIKAETRSRVMQAASELGYRIPQSYRGNGNEHDRNVLRHVGVFIETRHNSLTHPYLTGMSEASMDLNISLAIHFVKPGECESVLDAKLQPSAMRSQLLSGIVLIFWWPPEVVRVLSAKLPVVSIMHKYPGTDVDMVGIDNEGGIELLVRELHARGHRKIAFVGRCGRLHWANTRFAGYVAALASLGMEYQPRWVVDVDFDTIATQDAGWDTYLPEVERLIGEGVTAWVCASEPAGWQLHSWLTARGIRVPEDMSITGFHRPTAQEAAHPDLTSVGASYEAIGAAALKRLHYRIHNPAETPRTVLFPCEFYPGTTISCVPNQTQPQPHLVS